jgi:hypothetical protein
MKICNYGCGQEAKHQFKNGKWCCSKSINSCPNMKKINSINNKGERKGLKLSQKTKIKMSISKIGLQTEEKNPSWKGGYNKKNIPTFDQYGHQLTPIENIRRNNIDKNILEVKCAYCGRWFVPKLHNVIDRIRSINSVGYGDHMLYCSNKCKIECPVYKQHRYPKNFKESTSREVQPELRQMRFEIDNYTCQTCGKHQDELKVSLHCHHLEGIRWEPLESADIDKCITVCKICHKKIHKKEDCGYNDLKCN